MIIGDAIIIDSARVLFYWVCRVVYRVLIDEMFWQRYDTRCSFFWGWILEEWRILCNLSIIFRHEPIDKEIVQVIRCRERGPYVEAGYGLGGLACWPPAEYHQLSAVTYQFILCHIHGTEPSYQSNTPTNTYSFLIINPTICSLCSPWSMNILHYIRLFITA
jgi:hypothetical protein